MTFKRLLPLLCCALPAAFGCEPVRLGVKIENLKTFRKDAALVIQIRAQGETGQVCNATRAYQVTLTVNSPSGVLYSSADLTIPAGHSDPSAPYDSVRVSLKRGDRLVSGHISITATARGLLSGAASVTLSASAAPFLRQAWIIPVAYDPGIIQRVQNASRIGLSLSCESSGEVLANGKDAAILTVTLDSPAPRDVTLYFAKGSSDWNGTVTIPAGKTEMAAPVYITSRNTGDLTIDRLLKAGDESAFSVDAGSSCKITFVPPQYAFLALDTTRVILGRSATVAVTLMNAAKVPISDADQLLSGSIPLHLARGQGAFSPVEGRPGTYLFTPVAFGSAAIIFQRVESGMIRTLTGDPSNPESAPAVLDVGFPTSWIFWSVITSLAAALLHFQLLGQKQKLRIRCAVGVSAGLLLVLALTQPVMPVSHLSIPANTISVCILAFIGGWGGSTVINRFSGSVLPGSSDAGEIPPPASKLA